MGFIFIILIAFSAVWFFVWLWFFKKEKPSYKKISKAGIKAFKKGNYKKAKELFLQIPNSDINPEVKCKLGVVHLKLDEYDEAKNCFEQVLKNSPNNFDALFNLARTLQFQKKFDEAIEVYIRAQKENEKNIDCHLNIGHIHYEKGDYEKALEVLEKAKEIAPGNVKVLFSIVKCKSELLDMENSSNYQQIIDEYMKLAKKAGLPRDFDISLAKVYAKNGDIDKAFKHCKNAVEANAEDIEAYKLLGLIQLIKKDFSDAKNSLSIALNFQSNNAETHNLFSYLLCSHEEGFAMQKCRMKYYELIKKHSK